MKDLEREVKEEVARNKAKLTELEETRRAAIAAVPWSEADKELVLNREVRIGMTGTR